MAHETILVVDDEPAIVQVIRQRLEQEGFQVLEGGAGDAALAALAASPDLMVLDLMLPDTDGLEVLRRLRREGSDLPVIILTARDDDVDVVVGLELGADDYMVKPFNPRELVARVRAVLRRREEALLASQEARALAARVASLEARLPTLTPAGQPAPDDLRRSLRCRLRFDPPARRAWFCDRLLDLRPREYDLLLFLAEHAGQVLTRDTLLEQVWGTAEYIDDRTVDVHVHRLRQKLAQVDPTLDPIQTERGIGYRLEL
jgi:DNA-binding response OmpR family regulator